MLSLNENAIELLEEKIYYEQYIIRSNYSSEYLVNWRYLSSNPNAIHLLLDNKDKIDWCWLSKNPNAIHILAENKDKINWKYLSGNPNAIKLLTENKDNINWYWLSKNPSIFVEESNTDIVLLD